MKEDGPIVQQNEGKFKAAVVISQRPKEGQASQNSGMDWGCSLGLAPYCELLAGDRSGGGCWCLPCCCDKHLNRKQLREGKDLCALHFQGIVKGTQGRNLSRN